MSDPADSGRPSPNRRTAGLGVLSFAVAQFGLPLRVGAQQSGRTFRIGFLGTNRPDSPEGVPFHAAFEAGLRERGWQPGVNVLIAYRASEGNLQLLDEHAADLARAKVDVIVVGSYAHTVAARRATSTIPIVMIGTSDPVGFGFVVSLARPGGNVTGLTIDAGPELNTKPMQHLKEMRPGLARLAVLRMPSTPGWAHLERTARQGAQALQVSIEFIDANTEDQVEAAFAAVKKLRADALLAWFGPTGFRFREQVAKAALQAGLPSASQIVSYADLGGLMGFGPDVYDLCRRAAGYADKIFKGASPPNCRWNNRRSSNSRSTARPRRRSAS